MDLDEFRSFISDSGVDVWTWIDLAISVASADHENELKIRRDGIIQKLYAPAFSKCHNCDRKEIIKNSERDENYQQKQEEDDDDDNEQRKILEIKILLDDQNQSERSLIELLQRLVDMDTTFKALKETDIGRHVTKLRKHTSNEVRRLVKILVRKWKDTVDEWVRLNTPMEDEATQFNGDRNSPNDSIHNGVKHQVVHHTDSQKRKVMHNQIESDELGSAGKHLHDQNHQETQHAKKQRTSQVMDYHDIPKLKNSIISNNGGSVPVKYW